MYRISSFFETERARNQSGKPTRRSRRYSELPNAQALVHCSIDLPRSRCRDLFAPDHETCRMRAFLVALALLHGAISTMDPSDTFGRPISFRSGELRSDPTGTPLARKRSSFFDNVAGSPRRRRNATSGISEAIVVHCARDAARDVRLAASQVDMDSRTSDARAFLDAVAHGMCGQMAECKSLGTSHTMLCSCSQTKAWLLHWERYSSSNY